MRRARPPTRVNSACDRCRRQKQRCDDFRPCSNCRHARAECTTSDPPPSVKRSRFSKPPEEPRSGEAEDRTVVSTGDLPTVRNEQRGDQPHHYGPLDESMDHAVQSKYELDRLSGERRELGREKSILAELRRSESAIGITKRFLSYANSSPSGTRETFAIPGGDANKPLGRTPSHETLLSITEILGTDLPSRDISDALVDTYFYTVHWFSLVIYEPKFRVRYNTIMDRGTARSSDRAFLLLLLMVMVMGCWYGSGQLPAEVVSSLHLNNTRSAFLKIVSQNFMDLIDEDCLEFVQLSALLGSYWLYWGRPRSSFSILGAATKSAQAMELHRDSDNRLPSQDAEERKRVWWTIYTWDRFATIIYGRPLGINDKDCNVSMPASYSEDISFSAEVGSTRATLSPYQIQLNRIYQITSPLLENIYGIRYSHDRSLRSQMPSMVTKIDQLMRAWQDDLPPHLHLDKNDDVSLNSSVEEKMHRLQALSLQLTYDNLMIVIHRPLLADQGYRRQRSQLSVPSQPLDLRGDHMPSQALEDTNNTSFRQCINSALRISKVQQNKRNLLALTRGTHLVSFLGMNLFTSSVVLFICALSDTLSDIAHEAKRGMARNLKILKLLSGDGSLSMQCSVILEDLIQRILDREKQEMLRALPSDDEIASFLPTRRNSYIDPPPGVDATDMGLDSSGQTRDYLLQPNESSIHGASGNGGLGVHGAVASLQGVLRDVAAPRSAPPFDLSNTGLSNQQAFQPAGQVYEARQGSTRNEHQGFIFDGSNFNTEELGQFWLWNMDPCADDSVASWQSGDDQVR